MKVDDREKIPDDDNSFELAAHPENEEVGLMDTNEEEKENFKQDEEHDDLEFKYSRATNKSIHYGNYIPLFKNKEGIAQVLIGPDCKRKKLIEFRGFFCMSIDNIWNFFHYAYEIFRFKYESWT